MDDWLNDHDQIEALANELMHKLNQRNQYPTNTQPYAKSDLHIKDLFRKLQQKVNQLQEVLNHIGNSKRITQRECERRQRLVDNLISRCKQIEYMIVNPGTDRRSALFSYQNQSSVSSDIPTVGWNDLDNESDPSSGNQSVTQLRDTQRLLLQEQEKGFDTLGTIIEHQKHLARGINSEIDLHNEILEDIGTAFIETDERLTRNTRNIRVVDRKTSTCGYWTVIVLLLIAIIVVTFVPN